MCRIYFQTKISQLISYCSLSLKECFSDSEVYLKIVFLDELCKWLLYLIFLCQCKFFCPHQCDNKSFLLQARPAFWIYRHINTHPVVNKTFWFITHVLGIQLHAISIYTPSINETIEMTTYFICLEKRNCTKVFECLIRSCLARDYLKMQIFISWIV